MKPDLMKAVLGHIGRRHRQNLGQKETMKREIGRLPNEELKKILYSPAYRLPGETDELYKTRRYMKEAAQEILDGRKVSISRKK